VILLIRSNLTPSPTIFTFLTYFSISSEENIDIYKEEPGAISKGISGWGGAFKPLQSILGDKSYFNKVYLTKPSSFNLTKIVSSLLEGFDIQKIIDSIQNSYSDQQNSTLLEDCSVYQNETNLKLVCQYANIKVPEQITKEDTNEIIGLIFNIFVSSILILIIFFVIATIFYILKIFLNCCCCCRSDSDRSGVCAIITFLLGAASMFLAGLLITFGLINLKETKRYYKSSDQIMKALTDDAKETVEKIDETVVDFINVPIENIYNISQDIVTYISSKTDAFFDPTDKIVKNLTNDNPEDYGVYEYYNIVLKNLSSQYNATLDNIKQTYSQRYNSHNCPSITSKSFNAAWEEMGLSEKDPFIFLSAVAEYIELGKKITEPLSSLKEYSNISNVINDTLSPAILNFNETLNDMAHNGFAGKAKDALDNLYDMINESNNNEVADKIFNYLPYSAFIGGLMILTTIIFILAFFLRCGCSCCIASTAGICPFFCDIIILVVGILATILSIFAYEVSGPVVGQLDNTFNFVIDKVFPNRIITIPKIDMYKLTDGLINSTIDLGNITIGEFKLLQSILELNETYGIARFLGLNDFISFPTLGENIKKAINETSEIFELPESVIDFIEQINSSISNQSIIPESYDTFMGTNISEVIINQTSNLDSIPVYDEADPSTYCLISQDEVNSLKDRINAYSEPTGRMQGKYQNVLDNLDHFISTIISISASLPIDLKDIIKNILKRLANVVGDLISNILVYLDRIPAKPIVGFLKFLNNAALSPAISLSSATSLAAFLFIPGAFLCVLSLLIRRKHMLVSDENSSTDYSNSYSSKHKRNRKDSIKRYHSRSNDQSDESSDSSSESDMHTIEMQSHRVSSHQLNNDDSPRFKPYDDNDDSTSSSNNSYSSDNKDEGQYIF